MKKMLAVLTMALSLAAFGEMSLTEARGKVADIVSNPAKMQEVMSQLSAADQVTFLAFVNQVVEKLNASTDEKTALFNDINTAAMKSAKKGNLPALLAEMFATVPPESLTVINETFAANLFSRSADPSVKISDEDFANRAKSTLEVIQDRCAETDVSAVRTTFAILMFLRASEGTPADLRTTLVDIIPDVSVRNIALNEWIPAAMAEGFEKTYQPMLGASNAGVEPRVDNVLQLMEAQHQLVLLADLVGGDDSYSAAASQHYGQLGLPAAFETPTGIDRIPQTAIPGTPWNGEYDRGDHPVAPVEDVEPYPYQTTR